MRRVEAEFGGNASAGFTAAAALVASVVLVASVARLIHKATDPAVPLRPWTLMALILIASSVLLSALGHRHRVAYRAAQTALALATALLAALVLAAWAAPTRLFGFTRSLWPVDGDPAQVAATPPALTLIGGAALVVAMWLAAVKTRWAAATSATLYVAIFGVAMGVLLQLGQPGGIAVEQYFGSTAGRATTTALSVLAIVAAAVMLRPQQPPLGPLLATGMWPVAAFAVAILVVSTLLAQVGFQVADASGSSVETAIAVGFVIQSGSLIALFGCTVWFATVQQRRSNAQAAAFAATVAFSTASYHSAVPTLLVDRAGAILDVNPAGTESGIPPADDLSERRWFSLIEQWGDSDGVSDGQQPAWWPAVVTGRAIHTDRVKLAIPGAAPRWADLTAAAVADSDDEPRFTIVQLVNVTETVSAREELLFRAQHDTLTGLINRSQVVRLLDQGPMAEQECLVAILGLDRFGEINEAFGHSVGDQLLCAVAEQLQTGSPSGSIVGRLDGDEFAVVIRGPAVAEAGSQHRTAERLLASVEHDYSVGGYVLRPSASVGLVQRRSRMSGHELLRRASAALAAAKRAGGHRWQAHDHNFSADARDQLLLLDQLRGALAEGGQLHTWFQPIVSLSDYSTVGYEALSRWQHPERGLLPASRWIPAVESDLHVMHRMSMVVATQAAQFAQSLPAGRTVSLNISGRHLSSREFAEFVDLLLDLRRRLHTPLVLELTETALASVQGPALARLSQLVDVGYGLWGDDFGTGYSSVTHLRDFPLTGIKLDKSFTSALADSRSSSFRIADGVAGLAHGLGLQTVAEGIETPDQATRVAAAGWQWGQGWLFGHPNPSEHYLEAGTIAPGVASDVPRRSP